MGKSKVGPNLPFRATWEILECQVKNWLRKLTRSS